MLSNAGATAPSFNYLTNNQSIIGKMFKDEKTAYRAGIRLGFGGSKEQRGSKIICCSSCTSNFLFPSKAEVVENETKWSSRNIALTGGIEMRRGKTRLQGFYGGELGFGVSGTSSQIHLW
ncbi:MAG: hypothetical protein IPG89_05065 [Bacteroidetes bacterium]|nr:hypothetical protein [Bacteroidota bacterium]